MKKKVDPNRMNLNTGTPIAVEKSTMRAQRKRPPMPEAALPIQKFKLQPQIPFVYALEGFIKNQSLLDAPYQILLEAEQKNQVAIWMYTENLHDEQKFIASLKSDELRQSLFQFLDECPFIIDGMDFEAVITFGANYVYVPSSREWGSILSEWANSRQVGGRTNWEYSIFTYYTAEYLENAQAWEAALQLLIERKGRLPDKFLLSSNE